MNNGHATPFFELKRGVGLGDPLSPYLFIIVLELLAINIRNNNQIKGIQINGNEIELVIFADDITVFLRDVLSFSLLTDTIECFSKYSHLKMNHEKTEVVSSDNNVLSDPPHPTIFRLSLSFSLSPVIKIFLSIPCH